MCLATLLLGWGHRNAPSFTYAPEPAQTGLQAIAIIVLVAIALTVFALTSLGSAFVVSLRADWQRLAVRVAGSWIAAIGLLMIGWALRSEGVA